MLQLALCPACFYFGACTFHYRLFHPHPVKLPGSCIFHHTASTIKSVALQSLKICYNLWRYANMHGDSVWWNLWSKITEGWGAASFGTPPQLVAKARHCSVCMSFLLAAFQGTFVWSFRSYAQSVCNPDNSITSPTPQLGNPWRSEVRAWGGQSLREGVWQRCDAIQSILWRCHFLLGTWPLLSGDLEFQAPSGGCSNLNREFSVRR